MKHPSWPDPTLDLFSLANVLYLDSISMLTLQISANKICKILQLLHVHNLSQEQPLQLTL